MRSEAGRQKGGTISMRILVLMLLACAIGTVLSGCATQGTASRATEVERRALRVGITPDYPPVIFKRGGRVVGVEADLARELASALGRQVTFVELKWDEQIRALNDGKTDIVMSGMSVTRARQVRVDFCKPYLRNGLMAAVPADRLEQYRTPADILNVMGRVGVVKGTTGETFVRRHFPEADLVLLDKSADAPHFFAGRRIKMFIHDAYAIAWLVSENESDLAGIWDPLTDEDLAWAVRRGEPGFREAVNDLVAAWRNDGTLERILDRWMPRRGQIQWPQRTSDRGHE
jgi:polar amino acid transport system substrate-binding protein